MERFKRASVTGIATAAVLAGSIGVAMAVVSPAPPATGTGRDSARPAQERPTLTARATTDGVQAWHEFRVYGKARHLAPGTRVTLQQKQNGRWVTLPASMNLTQRSTYKMRVYLGLKGRNTLRIVGGGTVSPALKVRVH